MYSIACPVESSTLKQILAELSNTRNISEYYEVIPYESLRLAFIFLLDHQNNSRENLNKMIKELDRAFSYIDEFPVVPLSMYIYPNQSIGIDIRIDSVICQVLHKLRVEACKFLKIDRKELIFRINLAKSKKTMTEEDYRICKEEIIKIHRRFEKTNYVNLLKPALCVSQDDIKITYLS